MSPVNTAAGLFLVLLLPGILCDGESDILNKCSCREGIYNEGGIVVNCFLCGQMHDDLEVSRTVYTRCCCAFPLYLLYCIQQTSK